MFNYITIQAIPGTVNWLQLTGTLFGIIGVIFWIVRALIKSNRKKLEKELEGKVGVIEFEHYKKLNGQKIEEMNTSVNSLVKNVEKYNTDVLKGIEKISDKVDKSKEYFVQQIIESEKRHDDKLAKHREETFDLINLSKK